MALAELAAEERTLLMTYVGSDEWERADAGGLEIAEYRFRVVSR